MSKGTVECSGVITQVQRARSKRLDPTPFFAVISRRAGVDSRPSPAILAADPTIFCAISGGAMQRVLKSALMAVLVVLVSTGAAWAQATAQISGTVKDSSGGVLPGADVTVTQTETGLTRNMVTETDGSFTIPGLPV